MLRLSRPALLLLLAGLSASALAKAPETVNIGYQKANIFALLNYRGTLDESFKKQGIAVRWIEFPAGPQMLEGLNVGSIDLAATGDRVQAVTAAELLAARWLDAHGERASDPAWRPHVVARRLIAWTFHAPLLLSNTPTETARLYGCESAARMKPAALLGDYTSLEAVVSSASWRADPATAWAAAHDLAARARRPQRRRRPRRAGSAHGVPERSPRFRNRPSSMRIPVRCIRRRAPPTGPGAEYVPTVRHS